MALKRIVETVAALALGPEAELAEGLGEALPQYLPVDSSFITAIGFEPPDTIIVFFKADKGGKSYTYAGSKDLFDEFAAAGSKGQFFNSNIR
jgi:hypothetical protein